MPRKACYHSLNMKLRSAALPFLAAQTILAAVDAQHSFRGRGAVLLTNGAVELTVLKHGGSFASIVLAGDAERNNPMWDALRANRESGRPERQAGGTGHFVCVDGFGPPSAAEAAAGMQGHGEAHRLPWAAAFAGIENGDSVLRQAVTLPRVHELLQREVRLKTRRKCGVREIESDELARLRPARQLGGARNDRLAVSRERGHGGRYVSQPGAHAAAFGAAVRRARSPAYRQQGLRLAAGAGRSRRRRRSAGGAARVAFARPYRSPDGPDSRVGVCHRAAHREAALDRISVPHERLSLAANVGELSARGHARQRARVRNAGVRPPAARDGYPSRLFGRLLYRWLPARGRIDASYLLFWTRMPEGFRGVDEVQWSGGKLRIADRRSGQVVELAASGEL